MASGVCSNRRLGYRYAQLRKPVMSQSRINPELTAPPPAAPDAPAVPDLADLRTAIDRLDDALLDNLMQRAALVDSVATVKSGIALRPGREAMVLRRLLAKRTGQLVPAAVVRIWREIFAASIAQQGNFSVVVCETDPSGPLTALAREHFGTATRLRAWQSPSQVLAELGAGNATVAVLPLPGEAEPAGGWWTALVRQESPLSIVARLPFWVPEAEGAPRVGALAVAAVPPDPSDNDRTLLGLEPAGGASRARLLAALVSAGLPATGVLVQQESGQGYALADVAGFITADDPRLAAITGLMAPPRVLGAYAVPEGDSV